MNIKKPILCSIALTLALAATGCTSYYKVTDPESGKSFYSTKVDKGEKAGFVRLTDAKTNAVVTLQSSEVLEISKADYEKAVGTK